MRLIKLLEIEGGRAPLAAERVTLALNRVGSARFTLQLDPTLPAPEVKQKAVFWAGWADGELQPVLSGFISGVSKLDSGVAQVAVREWCAALDVPQAFALRHVTPLDVLKALTAACGVSFAVPEGADYLEVLQPYFAASGTCRTALAGMGKVWGLNYPVWFQQPDSRVYWGEWADSGANVPPADPFALDPAIVLEHDPDARAVVIPILPNLRPGQVAVIQGGAGIALGGGGPFLIQRVTVSGMQMRLEWDPIEA